jgi:hypothetical protein
MPPVVDEPALRQKARMGYLKRSLIAVLVVPIAIGAWAWNKTSNENAREHRLEQLGAAVHPPENFSISSSTYSHDSGTVLLKGDWPCPDGGDSCADSLAATVVPWLTGVGINDASASDLAAGLQNASGEVERTFGDHKTSVGVFCTGLNSAGQAANCTITVNFALKD